LGCTLLELDLR